MDIEELIEDALDEDSTTSTRSSEAVIEIGEPAVPALAMMLRKYGADVRKTIVTILEEIGGPSSAEVLIGLLKDKNKDVRWSAAWALGRIGEQSAVPHLVDALGDKEGVVRQNAGNALKRLGESGSMGVAEAVEHPVVDVRIGAVQRLGGGRNPLAVDALSKALKDSSKKVRMAAVESLMELRGPSAAHALEMALEDNTSSIREAAVNALAQMRGDAASAILVRALESEKEDVRILAAIGLGLRGEESAIPVLIEVLRARKKVSEVQEALENIGELAIPALMELLEDRNVKALAAATLDRIGLPRLRLDKQVRCLLLVGGEDRIDVLGEKVIPTLVKALEDDRYNPHIAARLLERLWLDKIGLEKKVLCLVVLDKEEEIMELGDEAVPALIKICSRSRDILWRTRAIALLGKIGNRIAVPCLARCLKEPDLMYGAADSLGGIGDRRAVPALIKALDSEDGSRQGVSETIIHALERIGDKKAVPALLRALKRTSWGEDIHAARALGNMRDKRAVPALLKALKKPSYNLRREAATALGKIGDRRAIPALIPLLDDSTWSVDDAIKALAGFGEAAVPRLIRKLGNEKLHKGIERTVWRIGKPAAPYLIKALQDAPEKHKDMIWKMIVMMDADAVPALVRFWNDMKFRSDCDRLLNISLANSTSEVGLRLFEDGVKSGFKDLSEMHPDKTELIDVRMKIARLMKKVAEKRNAASSERNMLLEDKPMPPRRGEMFRTVRRV